MADIEHNSDSLLDFQLFVEERAENVYLLCEIWIGLLERVQPMPKLGISAVILQKKSLT
jgi:hypothetical protein